MDEFKPEDELKPDASDRRPARSRKPQRSASAPKLPVSRQHMMMGIGILVLLLLVLGIGSALKGPDKSAPAQQSANNNAASSGSGNEKNIDLTGSASMTGQQTTTTAPANNGAPTNGETASGDSNQPRDISMPAVSPTPTQAAPVETPANQQRVTLPGDLNSALSNQQGQVDDAAQGAQGDSSLPTAPATVSGSGNVSSTAPVSKPQPTHSSGTTQHAAKPAPHKTQPAPVVKQSKPQSGAASRSNAPASSSGSASKTLPGGSYTLQLSSASRSDTLNAWAKKQNLSGYHVYKTTRNGEPWYVLISGSYATPADAKRAVASLPAEVRAQNPWVKPVSQVKKEAGN